MTTTEERDLIGRERTEDERALLDAYRRVERLARREDLAPCVQMNVRQALVMLWNAANDLGLLFEEPPD